MRMGLQTQPVNEPHAAVACHAARLAHSPSQVTKGAGVDQPALALQSAPVVFAGDYFTSSNIDGCLTSGDHVGATTCLRLPTVAAHTRAGFHVPPALHSGAVIPRPPH